MAWCQHSLDVRDFFIGYWWSPPGCQHRGVPWLYKIVTAIEALRFQKRSEDLQVSVTETIPNPKSFSSYLWPWPRYFTPVILRLPICKMGARSPSSQVYCEDEMMNYVKRSSIVPCIHRAYLQEPIGFLCPNASLLRCKHELIGPARRRLHKET